MSRRIAEQIVANFSAYQQHAVADAGMSDTASATARKHSRLVG